MSSALALQNGNGTLSRNDDGGSLGEMTVEAIVERKRKILKVMEAVMTSGEHYGKIPGCGDKPTLLKAGAEVLATVFGLAPTFDIQEKNFANGHREYRVVCTLTHIGNNRSLGQGVGVCSTMESKYRWRAGGRKCPECGVAAIMKSKYDDCDWFCFGKKGGCGAKFFKNDVPEFENAADRIENPDVADTYNTVLKMAKKRAQVDATLTAVGASDILTQDIEDLPLANADAIDAEFTERPAQQHARPSGNGSNGREPAVFAQIDKATTEPQLEALIPQLKSLDARTKAEGRKRYAARKQWIKQQAAKQEPQKQFDPPPDDYAFDPEADYDGDMPNEDLRK